MYTANAISMIFSRCQNYLCCSFDSQTVHIVYLKEIERDEAIQDYRNSYYQRFIKSPLTEAGKYYLGYNIDTVLCDKTDFNFKCESKYPVILAVEVNEDLNTIKFVIDECFYMNVYECNLGEISDFKKIGSEIKKKHFVRIEFNGFFEENDEFLEYTL